MKNHKEISLVAQLDNLDFSSQSLSRDRIGLELNRRIFRTQSIGNKSDQPTRKGNMFRNPLPAFVLGFFLALAGFSVAHPDTRGALMKTFYRVGNGTVIISGGQKTDLPGNSSLKRGFEERIDTGEDFAMGTIYGGYGCGVPEGADPFMKQTPSLQIAAGLVNRTLMVPTYFHEALSANMHFQKAEILPNGMAALYFGAGPYETRLTQQLVDQNNTVTYSTSTLEVKADGSRVTTYLDPQLEELNSKGISVFWQAHDEGTRRRFGRWAEEKTDTVIGRFYWEDGGQSFTLDGRFLTKEEGLKIINSLEPYNHK